jgi:hypothetical protein
VGTTVEYVFVGKEGGRGGREGRRGDTYLVKLIRGHHCEGRNNQVSRDAHPSLQLLPKIKELDVVARALISHKGTEGFGLVSRHTVCLGQERNEGYLGGNLLG